MMLTKEEYEKKLDILARYCSDSRPGFLPPRIELSDELDEFEQLIKEHFDPEPYRFEELHENMWVWDEEIGACMFVKEVNRKINIVTLVGGESFLLETVHITVKFEENRFYPVTKTLEAK